MSARAVVTGRLMKGVVVPDRCLSLPEGARVEILLPEIPELLQAEFDAWETASDEDLAGFEAILRDEAHHDAQG